MMRTIGASALAIGAVLSLNGIASAGDDNPTRSSFGTTMTLGGQGTAAEAAAADDTELTHYYRRGYYGGYRGFYGGYRGFYGGGFRGGFVGYRSFNRGFVGYRPFYPGFVGYRPFHRGFGYWPNYGGFVGYRPFVQPYYTVGYGFGGFNGYYCGISGTNADADAPVVSLNMAVTKAPLMAEPASGFQYDGDRGTVPLPTANPGDQANPQPTGLPVSLQRAKPSNPYTFKAYGEK